MLKGYPLLKRAKCHYYNLFWPFLEIFENIWLSPLDQDPGLRIISIYTISWIHLDYILNSNSRNQFQTFSFELTSTVLEWWCRREGFPGIRKWAKEFLAESRPSRRHSSRKKSIWSDRGPITWSSPQGCTLKEYRRSKRSSTNDAHGLKSRRDFWLGGALIFHFYIVSKKFQEVGSRIYPPPPLDLDLPCVHLWVQWRKLIIWSNDNHGGWSTHPT